MQSGGAQAKMERPAVLALARTPFGLFNGGGPQGRPTPAQGNEAVKKSLLVTLA